MAATAETFTGGDDVAKLRERLTTAQTLFERQSAKIESLEWECDAAGVARDKALYYLFRLSEAAQREQWPMSAEAKEALERGLDVLAENNIYTGLDEPDAAILWLMEVVERDQEGHDHVSV
ncbi:MAG TPA: hypothetical protein VFA21_20365 [Pyrinomonadaceae bacterium]|nr:hypothetical protein [Pyrinomonadaceae bacterium]